MKTFKSTRGPFVERPFYKDQEVESMCSDELRSVGLLPNEPGPIRIDRFIEKHFKIVPCYEPLPASILGLTQFSDSGPARVIVSEGLEQNDTTVNERRIRSTLAHEAGHCMLHTHLFAFAAQGSPLFGDHTDPKAPKVLCREPQPYAGEWWEFQANLAMSMLLLPAHLVHTALSTYLRPAGLLQIPQLPEDQRQEAVRSLVEVFNVNPVMIKIRLEKLYPTNASGNL